MPAGRLTRALAATKTLGFLPAHRLHHRQLRHVYMAASARRCFDCGRAWAGHVNLLTARAQCQGCFARWCDAWGGLMLRTKAVRQYLLEPRAARALPSVGALVDGVEFQLVARSHADALGLARWGSLEAIEAAKPELDAELAMRRIRALAQSHAAQAGAVSRPPISVVPPIEPINRGDAGRGVTADAAARFILFAVGFPDKDDPARPLRLDEVTAPHDFIVCRFCLDASQCGGRLPAFKGYAELFAEHHAKDCPCLPPGFVEERMKKKHKKVVVGKVVPKAAGAVRLRQG